LSLESSKSLITLISRYLGHLSYTSFKEFQLFRQQLEERLTQLEGLVSRLTSEKGGQAHALDRSHEPDTSNRTPLEAAMSGEIEKLVDERWMLLSSPPVEGLNN